MSKGDKVEFFILGGTDSVYVHGTGVLSHRVGGVWEVSPDPHPRLSGKGIVLQQGCIYPI